MQYPIWNIFGSHIKNLDHTMISVLVIGYVKKKTFFFKSSIEVLTSYSIVDS